MKKHATRHTVQEIADLIGGEIIGDAQQVINGIADVRHAASTQLAFLSDPRYFKAAKQTRAAALLISPDIKEIFSTTVIRVKNPLKAFGKIAVLFTPPPLNWPKKIHPTAIVSPDAKIGHGVHISPHVVIEAGAEIEDGCHIGAGCYIGHYVKMGLSCFLHPRVVIEERCILGNRVNIHAGTVIGSDGFGYEFNNGRHEKIPQIGYVQIDDDVEIGANVTIDRGRFDKTWIQEGAKIDNLVMIAHNVVVGKHTIIVAQAGLAGSVHCGSYVTIAGQAGIAGHISIGDKATVTAKVGVTKDCEPGIIYSGYRARPMQESMKLEACTHRVPELIERVKKLEKEFLAKTAKSF